MTTIPIEVIVQDAEAPIVPGEDGTNTNTTETTTNVAVPDTGEGNGNIFTGSASSVVLPVVLLVLALGSIVAILIHKYHKQKNDKATRKEKLAVATSSTIAVLAATVLVSNLILPATKAATSDVTDGITPAEDKISIKVTRDGSSAEVSVESTATITSSNNSGYKVLLSMTENADSANLYLDGDETSEYYIAPITANDEESETEEETEGIVLADNTWGYALEDGTNYTAVPLVDNAATVAQGDEAVEDEALSIYYGVMVSSSLPAGTYSGGEIDYNLVSLEPSDISELIYMQDFAKLSADSKSSVLRSMTEGEQYTLKDSRDQKGYYISKLADGNVWMTQNLDHNIGDIEGGKYTPDDTDIPADWTPASSEFTYTTGVTTWNSPETNPESYDPGTLYWNGILNPSDRATCEEYGGTWSQGCNDANLMSSTGDNHYHLGNYYNWTAAVAMSDSSSYAANGTDVNQSICPAGWRLPTYSGDKSFDNLKTVASLTSGPSGNFYINPNYFSYGGDWSSSGFYEVGRSCAYWSSVVYNDGSSYDLFSYSYGFINPQNQGGRNKGYSVRCVAR